MHRYFDDDDYADYDDDMRHYNSRKKKRTREDLDVINYEPYYLDDYTEQTRATPTNKYAKYDY